MFARGQKLAEVPENTWFSILMRADLGKANGRWSVALAIPGSAAREFKDLPCDRDWKEARGVGFIAPGTANAAYELDDIEMEARAQ